MTVRESTLITWGRIVAGTSVVAAIAALTVMGASAGFEFMFETGGVHIGLLAIGFGTLVWAKITTEARNGAVWALAGNAFFGALSATSFAVVAAWGASSIPGFTVDAAFRLIPAEVPLPVAVAMQTAAWTWLPALFFVLTLGLLLFPDGKPPSPRWRWVGWYFLAGMVLVAGFSVMMGGSSATIPILGTGDVETLDPRTARLVAMSELLDSVVMLGAVFSIASLVVRYSRSTGVVRRQIRWIGWGTTVLFLAIVWTLVVDGTSLGGTAAPVALAAETVTIVSFAVAITKYRLYDIDIVISRTVAYVSLGVVVAGLYAGAVFGLVALFGDSQEVTELGAGFWFGATALVAIVFEPLRVNMERWAHRLVYGRRAAPHQVLSQLTSTLADTASGEGLIGLARLLREGTGADSAEVWLRVGDSLRSEVVSPADALSSGSVFVSEGDLPHTELQLAVPVRHGGEVLGALGVTKSRAHPVTPADEGLLSDVAASAGLLLRNLRLNAELAERAVQIRRSRRRLIAAHDAARHRLERDLHDGAQQQVVALKVRLGLAKSIAEKEGAHEVAVRVASLADGTQQAVDAMRITARGIYPPLLEAEGLGVALTAAHRTVGLPLHIDLGDLPRYSRQVEETVYFCVLAAVARAEMAGASAAGVDVRGDRQALAITVVYDAPKPGDLTELTDRAEAFGGTVTTATSGQETTLTVTLPIDEGDASHHGEPAAVGTPSGPSDG